MSNIKHALIVLRDMQTKKTQYNDAYLDAMETSYHQGLDHAVRTIELFCPELKEVQNA